MAGDILDATILLVFSEPMAKKRMLPLGGLDTGGGEGGLCCVNNEGSPCAVEHRD